MKQITWGIIGCGDVAEIKSGPAFNIVEGSRLHAVMRRNTEKAQDFAKRHNVNLWYDDYDALLENADIDAVYIATPPDSHLEIALKALAKGKMVYLEKPMTRNFKEASRLLDYSRETKNKICVAHYRRALPSFLKVKELLESNAIGSVRMAEINIRQAIKSDLLAKSDENWRVHPEISGGGYFYDLAPHQIDLLLLYFGDVKTMHGVASNQSHSYPANDIVSALIQFKNGVHFSGTWAFNVHESQKKDRCTIYGQNGAISFSFYGEEVELTSNEGNQTFKFENPKHIQAPMIQKVVKYFQGETSINPCSVSDGCENIRILESITTSCK